MVSRPQQCDQLARQPDTVYQQREIHEWAIGQSLYVLAESLRSKPRQQRLIKQLLIDKHQHGGIAPLQQGNRRLRLDCDAHSKTTGQQAASRQTHRGDVTGWLLIQRASSRTSVSFSCVGMKAGMALRPARTR